MRYLQNLIQHKKLGQDCENYFSVHILWCSKFGPCANFEKHRTEQHLVDPHYNLRLKMAFVQKVIQTNQTLDT